MKRRTALRWAALPSLLALGAVALSACSEKTAAFAAIDISGAEYARDFALSDHNGRQRSLKDFAGKVVVLFFGYTQCPDVCPTTMLELAQVKKLLGADGDRLQALFISIDPQRDTPDVLKPYMANFDPTFLALCPTPEQLAATARDFKVYYKKVDGPTPTSYTMDHSAGSYVYDTRGKLRLFTRYGSGVPGLVSDVRILLAQAA